MNEFVGDNPQAVTAEELTVGCTSSVPYCILLLNQVLCMDLLEVKFFVVKMVVIGQMSEVIVVAVVKLSLIHI